MLLDGHSLLVHVKKRTEADARVRLPVLDEGVVVRGEERAALELLHQELHHGVRDGGAVEGGGAWINGDKLRDWDWLVTVSGGMLILYILSPHHT